MSELVRYEAARRALAEAVAVDEVKQIHDEAEAMRHAARIAKDKDLEIQSAQIRFRAERRLGELIGAQKRTVGLNAGSRGQLKGREVSGGTKSEQPEDNRPTLAEAGIDRKLSSRAQRVAELPPEKFDALLEQHADEMRAGVGRVAMDLLKVNADQEGRQARRELAKTLSDASAVLPTGRQYPVIYADPPWQRKQGVTSRSYENHYPTMTWSEICALPVKDIVLPDAWLFLWIPRAHAFALHDIETEVTLLDGEVVRAKVEMPLAWAVAQSWGFDAYSTAFVWTKTDEDHPDEAGGAVLVRDQDELLLMFKRGRGLPKPDNGEKFGSNHRERSRPLGHSTKPQHYRRMIATMAGADVPVLEMFARFDADNPPPPGWHLWGNEAGRSQRGASASEALPERADGKVGGVAGACSALAAASEIAERREPDVGSWRENEQIADSDDASPFADQPATPGTSPVPGDRIVDTVADEDPIRPETAVPPAGRPGSNFLANAVDSPAHRESEPEGMKATVSRAADGRSSEKGAAVSMTAAPVEITPAPVALSEFEALKLLSDFCDPRRADLLPRIAADYAERGLAIQQGATGQWMLRETGWSRLRELEAKRRACEPVPAIEPHPLDIPEFLRRTPKKPQIKVEPQLELALARIDRAPPEIIDGKLQTRMPLAVEDLAIQAALLAIDAGEIADRESVHHAESEGYLHVTTKSIRITDEGRAWLAQLVTPASAPRLEERA
jgi:N6-adenosine-specific RNA methylase IME4